jgi:ketosteroid isomerase-like protein
MADATAVTMIRALVDDHFRHTIAKHAAAIIDRYVNGEHTYVFVEGPRWSTTGIDRIATGWRAYVGADMAMTDFRWVEGPHVAVSQSMAWHAGIVDVDMLIRGAVRQVRFRATHVFTLDADGQWRIEHEHFSQPAADPYGIGDWLPSRASA